MKSVLVLTIGCICFAQIINGASISYVKERVVSEQNLINALFYNAQTAVYDRTTNAFSVMNEFAEEVKHTMISGSDNCRHWIQHLQAAQSLATSNAYLTVCEISDSPVKDLHQVFAQLRRNVVAIEALCDTHLEACQTEAEDLNNYLNLLHESVDANITASKKRSIACISGKIEEFQRQVEITYDNWRTCA